MDGRGERGAGALVVLLAAILMASAAFPQLATAQHFSDGDFFEYRYVQRVSDGTGGYHGYSESTISKGKYSFTPAGNGTVAGTASYSWRYRSSDRSLNSAGSETEQFTFSPVTGLYISGFDLDVDHGPEPSIWFWIDPNISLGETVRILNDTFTVVSLDARAWAGWLPYRAIMLESTGRGSRDDEYGRFHYTYVDRYYFDAGSGFIIAECYTQHNTGYWGGIYSTFEWTEEFWITGSSYSPPLDHAELASRILTIIAIFTIPPLLAYSLRWMGRTHREKNKKPVKIRRLWKMKDYPRLPDRASRNFKPFLEDFAGKALLSGGRVAYAVCDAELVGLAIYHRDVRMGVIFCPEWELNEALRRYMGAKDFFSETKHCASPGKTWEAEGVSRTAYNVFETYRVLRLDNMQPMNYDTGTVRPMEPGDLPHVARISKEAYRVKSDRWLRAQLDSGDLGFVARVDGRVVGFAFATVSGTSARFHTLTVAKDMRGRGLGKTLMRARLHAAYMLGAKSALVEIADWNLPSLNISGMFGFKPVGEMYVETVRTRRIDKNIVRR